MARVEKICGQRARDEGARPDPALEIALGQKLLERAQDGDAGDPQLGGQGAGRGEPLTGAQAAAHDRFAVAVVDLPVEGRPGPPVVSRRKVLADHALCALL